MLVHHLNQQMQACDRLHRQHDRAQEVQRTVFAVTLENHQPVSRHRWTVPTAFVNISIIFLSESNMAVGDRVIVSSGMGSRAGILQYIGETKFAPGNWCGVQLDEPSGKNDGTVDDVQYVIDAFQNAMD